MLLSRRVVIALMALTLSIYTVVNAAPAPASHHNHHTHHIHRTPHKHHKHHKHHVHKKTHTPTHQLPHTSTESASTQPTTFLLSMVNNSTDPTVAIPTPPKDIQALLATSFGGCPPPLVPNIHNIVSKSCTGPCCLPCPAASVFYEPGILETLNDAISIIRAVSCAATLFLGISYVILPGRMQDSHLVLLFIFFTNALWQGLGVVWLSERENLTCHNEVEETSMKNNDLCGAQGILLVYFTGVLFCQGITLLSNLFALIVYKSSRLQHHLVTLLLLSFVLPVALVAYPWAQQSFGYVGYGSVCFMTSDLVDAYFFYPIMAMMAFGVLLYCITVGYMIKMYIQKDEWTCIEGPGLNATFFEYSKTGILNQPTKTPIARDIGRLLHQQWRPGAFVLCQLTVFWFYFAFYFLETKKFERIEPTSSWFQQWTSCLGEQAALGIANLAALSATPPSEGTIPAPLFVHQLGETAQRACQHLPAPFVPQYYKLVLSDIGPPAFGIIIFLIFGSKSDLWRDWKQFIVQKILRRPSEDDLQTFKIVDRESFHSKPPPGYDGHSEKHFGEKSPSPLAPLVYKAVSRPSATHTRQGHQRFESPNIKTPASHDHSAAPADDDGFIPYRPPLSDATPKADVKRSVSLQQRLLRKVRTYAQENQSAGAVPRRSNTVLDHLPRDRVAQTEGEQGDSASPANRPRRLSSQSSYSGLNAIPETTQQTLSRSSSSTSSSSSNLSQVGYYGDSTEVRRARHVMVGSPPVIRAPSLRQYNNKRLSSGSTRQPRPMPLEEEDVATWEDVHFLARLHGLSSPATEAALSSKRISPPPSHHPPVVPRRDGRRPTSTSSSSRGGN